MDQFLNAETQTSRLREITDSHHPKEDYPTLPTQESIQAAESSLPSSTSPTYLSQHDPEDVARHITRDILPALTGQSRSSRYYGFVTGGVLPVAQWADNLVTHMDQNVQVHLPAQTVATSLENRALAMLADVLGLPADDFPGRTFTTGATGSNVLGLAAGREAIIARKGGDVGELGILGACARAGVTGIQVLTSGGHSSLSKAASVVGLGRQSVKELGVGGAQPWRLDIDAVEKVLEDGKQSGAVSIIAISAGEVNTGRFAVEGMEEMRRLRGLADEHGAWIHVDGAFGIFARVLDDTQEFKTLRRWSEGIELADSITIDGHKMLNVPYDCGMLFTRSIANLQAVFTNPNAAYLSSNPGQGPTIPSPLNVGLENSRRFRALSAYAVLLTEGRQGLARMVANMVRLSRKVAAFVRASEHYDLLPDHDNGGDGSDWVVEDEVFMIVLLRAKNKELNDELVGRINETRQMYVSGTSWRGEKAVRVAVSNWKVDVERDSKVATSILSAVAEGRTFDMASV